MIACCLQLWLEKYASVCILVSTGNELAWLAVTKALATGH